MVAPLAVIALVWDRCRNRATRLLAERSIRLRLGKWQRQMPLGGARSGLLMIAMGVLSVALAFTGPGMPSGGWQTALSAWLQHVSALALDALSWIPGWALALVLLLGLGLVIRRALRTHSRPEPVPATVEETRRDQDQ